MDWKEGLDDSAVKLLDKYCEGEGDERNINIGKLAKGYSELHTKFSSSPKIPAEDADPETWNKFYDRLGRPKKIDEYSMDKSKMPKDFPWDEDFETEMKQAAHEAGMSTKQFQKIADKFLQYNGSSYQAAIEASTKAREAALNELKKECEEKKTDFEVFVNIAKHAVKEVDDKEGTISKYLESTGLGDDPVFIKLFNGIGHKILDDTLVQGIQTHKTGTPKVKGQYEKEFHERYPTEDTSA